MSDYEIDLRNKIQAARNENAIINVIEFELDHRLTEEEFIVVSKIVRELYSEAKIRFVYLIKKIKEYGIEPDIFASLPFEFKLWELYKNKCRKTNNKYVCMMKKDERKINYIDYTTLFVGELDFLNDMDFDSITKDSNLDDIIPESLHVIFDKSLSDKTKLEDLLRKFMREKIRRLRLHNSSDRDKLDKPYMGPIDSKEVIEEYNKIFIEELDSHLDVNLEYEKYRKTKFFFPELWEPLNIEFDFQIAQEMISDPNFIDNIEFIWTGFEDNFDLKNDYYGYYTSIHWLISCEYDWLIHREEAKEKPDQEKIDRLQRDAAWNCSRGISPILLKYYSYFQIKRLAYESYKNRVELRKTWKTQ